MRKIEAQMVCAVRDRLIEDLADWRSGNTEVRTEYGEIQPELTLGQGKVVVVYLHGNKIAEFDTSLNHARACRGLMITDAGWQTATTKSRLNALLGCFYGGMHLCQVKGEWLLNTTPFAGTDWVSFGWRGEDSWVCQQAEALAA